MKCLDNEDGNKVVCTITVDELKEGKIEIPRDVIESQRGLDEMIVVAATIMHRMRARIWKEGAVNVGTTSCDTDTETRKNTFILDWQLAAGGGGGGA